MALASRLDKGASGVLPVAWSEPARHWLQVRHAVMQHIWYCAGWGLRVTLYEKYHCELLAKCGSLELFLRHRIIIMITWNFKSVSFSLMFWSLIGYSCRKGHQEIERRKDNCVLVFIPVFFLHSFFTWSAQLCNGERIVYCIPIIKSWKEDAFCSPWASLNDWIWFDWCRTLLESIWYVVWPLRRSSRLAW